MITQSFILFIVLTAFISCHSVDKKDSGNKEKLSIVVEVVPEGDSSYSISWKDTLGQSAGYRFINRPYEVWCYVMDKSDTVGYYRGRSNPSDYTYFSTTDTTVNVTFMIGPNFFSEQRYKSITRDSETVIEFNPVILNLKSGVRKPIEFVLTAGRKLPLIAALKNKG